MRKEEDDDETQSIDGAEIGRYGEMCAWLEDAENTQHHREALPTAAERRRPADLVGVRGKRRERNGDARKLWTQRTLEATVRLLIVRESPWG